MSALTPKPGPGLRNPTSNAQNHGRIVNPPRYAPLGGLSSADKAQRRNDKNVVPPGPSVK